MRNLQKILALALALIMSFSLVATAGAFSDDGDISDSYKTAVNVLNGLEVFKGYDNGATFQPKGNITRAEVAAIIYRIATGDVTDSQASIYSTYGQFTDVADGSWYAGYVNYCANAGYIKGRGNKIFDPQGQVTGYEALAMILRAVGYDKNGEFTGSNWQIRTASIANQRGITKNVTEGMLGQAATRETVAEILFRAILVNQVDFSANTLSYTEKATSLGYDSLKLEEIEGVITANEYADLNEDDTLPDGRTEMLVDGKDYTIDYTTTLDDIGESHIAYIQNGKKVLAINDREEGNATAESTAKIKDEDALKAFAKENSISLDKSAERYINFSKGYRWMSDWRIRYEINFVSTFGGNDFNAAEAEYERERATYKWTVGLDEFKKSDGSYNVKQLSNGKYLWIYEASFKAGDEIGSDHQSNIQSIFDYADRFVEVKDLDTRDAYTYGEVYAGTSSLKDLSDSMSYNQFVTEYINQDTEATVNDNENGNWVKIIDNDKDGVADYVLKVIYTTAQVDKVSDSAVTLDTKDIDFGSDEDNINEITSQKVVSADTLAVNDIVYYAVIDGKAQTYKATPVTAKIDKVNRNDLTATTADGTVYTQSGVCEHVYNPDYTPDVRGMADGVSYDMYLGRGDYMLVFVKSVAKSFTLLVDGYYNSTSKDDQYAVKAYQDGRINNVDVGRDGDLFIDGHTLNNGWGAMRKMGGAGNLSINAKDGDQTFLKTAVAGLDENGNLIPVDFASVYERGSHAMISIPKPVRSATQETYYTGIFKDGATDGYAYATSKTAYDTPVVPVGAADNKVEIRALSSTVYYFVWKENNAYHVKEYVGYGAVPSLSVEELKTVEDIYAVGTRHERVSTSGDRDRYYYTADVVVVELNKAYKKSAEQIFVADSPIVGNGVRIDTLTVIRSNGVKEDIQVDLTKSILTYDVNYDEAGYKKVLPGVYNLYPTSEEGIYTIEYMNRNKIVSEGLSFMIGNVNTKQYTADSNYVGIDTMVTGGAKTYRSNGELQKKLTADTKYYTLDYEPEVKNAAYDRQNARLDESTLSTVLKPRVEESKFIKDNFVYDLDREFDWQDRYGCYNNVLVCYDDSEAVYVVSFQNYDDDMPAARYGDHWELDAAGNRVGGYTDYAQHVWESMIPDPTVAQDTQTPTVELRTADGGKEQIAVLNPGTNDIPWAVWSKFAGRIDELYITPKANHSVSVDGKLSWTNQSKAFAAEEKNVPASNALTTDDGVGKTYSFRVVNQVSGGMTEVLDYSYSFVPVNTNARLLDRNGSEVAGVIEIPNNSGNIEGYLEANFKLGSEFSTAVWNFSGKNNEESSVTMTMDAAGVVTAANSNLRVNEFTEVMLNTEFDVTVTAQSGDTITYKVKVVPSAPVLPNHDTTKYDEAKAAFDAVEDLTAADEATLNNIKDLILKAQETADADGLTAEEIADLADMLAKVEAALTPETTTVKVNVTGLRVDQETSARTPFSFDADVANGEFTVRDLAFLEGMDANAWVPVAMWNDDVTVLGVGTIQNDKKFWTVKGIQAGTTEINLTVIYATPDELKDLPPIIPPMPAARIARAAAGTTTVIVSTWLADGKVPGVHSVTNPIGVEVEPNFAFASQVAQEDGFTLWTIIVIIHQGNLSKDEITNMGITFDAKPDVPGPDDLTQAKADATKAVNEYKTAEIAALTGDDAAAAEKAKTDALAAIEAAESVDAVNQAVADYKAAIDALTAVEAPKLSVKAFGENRAELQDKIYGKRVDELQDGITATLDGTTYTLEGTVYHVIGWEAAYGTNGDEDGYFVALKMGYPGRSPESIRVEKFNGSGFAPVNDETTSSGSGTAWTTTDKETGIKYGLIVRKLVLGTDNKFKNFTVKAGGETYTFDTSKLVPTGQSGVAGDLIVAVATDDMVKPNDTVIGSGDGQKLISDLHQSDVAVTFDGTRTFTVTGTVNYVTDFSKWSSNTKYQNGNYVALKFAYPGVTPEDIKITNPATGGADAVGNEEGDGTDADGNVYGIVVCRLTKLASGGYKPINIAVAGKTYTVKMEVTCVQPSEDLVIRAATDDDEWVTPILGGNPGGKKVSELHDGEIAITGPVDNKYTVTGAVNYVTGFTAWAGNEDEAAAKGNFIALTFDYPDPTQIKIGEGEKPLEADGVLVWKITPQGDGTVKPITFTVSGATYTIDLNNVDRHLAGDLIFTVNRTGELGNEFGNKDRNALVGDDFEIVKENGKWVAKGTVLYNSWTKGWAENYNPGYYVVCTPVATDGSDVMLWSSAEGENGGFVNLDHDELVWQIGNAAGKRAEKLRFKVWDQEIDVDLSGLIFDAELEVTDGSDNGFMEIVSDERKIQALDPVDVIEDKADPRIVLTGEVFYQERWTEWSGDDSLNSGYFVALNFATPGDGTAVVKNGLNQAAANDDLNGDTLVLKIAAADGTILTPDRTIQIIHESNVQKEYTFDLSQLNLIDANGEIVGK